MASPGIWNQDSSFFSFNNEKGIFAIFGSDLDNISKRVKSISFTEEFGKMGTGSINMTDRVHAVSSFFVYGSVFEMTIGYSDPLRTFLALLPEPLNPIEYIGPAARTGITAVVMGPSGKANAKGGVDFNINFRSGFTMVRDKVSENHFGTRQLIINKILLRNLVTPIVLFKEMVFTHIKVPLVQSLETDFQFLRRLAKRWKVNFLQGTNLVGQPVVFFGDPVALDISGYKLLTTGAIGFDHLFEWREGLRNVISYDWTDDFGQDGEGDTLNFQLVDGNPVGSVSISPILSIQAKSFDMVELTAALNDARKTDGVEGALALYQKIILATDFKDALIQRFWTDAEFQTYTPGRGLSITLDTFGNPLYNPGSTVKFGKGFPKNFQDVSGFKIVKVTHTIDKKKGYRCKIECKDRLFAE